MNSLYSRLDSRFSSVRNSSAAFGPTEAFKVTENFILDESSPSPKKLTHVAISGVEDV